MLKVPPLVCDTGIILRFGITNQLRILESLYSGRDLCQAHSGIAA